MGVPIKPFGVAKARLSPVLNTRERRRLGQGIAARTVATVQATGAIPAVVTGDPGVMRWARRRGWRVVAEEPGGGLDGAGRALVRAAGQAPWAFLHADLPLLTVDDLTVAWEALAAGAILAPSHDGGTSLIGGRRPTSFSFGPGSFQRHLASVPTAKVICRPGLALDLDTAEDLAVSRQLAGGRWLGDVIHPAGTPSRHKVRSVRK